MQRTAIEAPSPDRNEIRKSLPGTDVHNTCEGQQALNSRLILAVVVLLFPILALDLLMAGGLAPARTQTVMT